MKTKRFLYSILLAVLCCVQTQAQNIEDGEAFYIYRNDGDFNGFFFDEVIDMRYSKLDNDNVEHDEYVMQEVETADSIYRIPLAAIDSIGFVQPEIVLNPRLCILEQSGLEQYLYNCGFDYNQEATEDSKPHIIVRLNNDTPADMIPKVGDILVSTEQRVWWATDGFAMRVEEVQDRPGEWVPQTRYHVIGTEIESLGEVFQKFISTESITMDNNGKQMRRMAGLNKVTRANADANVDLLNISGTLVREFTYGNGTLGLTADYAARLGIKATYDVDIDHVFVKIVTEEDLSAQVGFSAAFTSSAEVTAKLLPDWIASIKFPAVLPIFETNPLPQLFCKLQGKVELKSKLPSVNFKGKQMVIFSDRTGNWLNCSASSNLSSGYGSDDNNLIQPGESSITISGSIHSGIKFKNTIETNGWASRVFHSSIGLETYVGPKIETKLNIDLTKDHVTTESIWAGYHDRTYDNYVGSSISISPCVADIEAKAKVNFYGYPEQETKFAEGSYSLGKSVERYFLETLHNYTMEQDKDLSTVKFNMDWSRDVFFGNEVGVIIYKMNFADRTFSEVTRNMSYHYSGTKSMEYEPTLEPGFYYAIPAIKFLKRDLEVRSYYDSNGIQQGIGPQVISIVPDIILSPESLEVPPYNPEDEYVKQTLTIPYSSDYPDITFRVYAALRNNDNYIINRVYTDEESRAIVVQYYPNRTKNDITIMLRVDWGLQEGSERNKTYTIVFKGMPSEEENSPEGK